MEKTQNHLKQLFYTIFLIVALPQFSSGQSLKITHGPFIQHLTTDSVTVNWSTSEDCISWVEYYEDDGSNFYLKDRDKVYNSLDGLKNIGKTHMVSLLNLKPDTKYAYRIYSQKVTEDGHLTKVVATKVYKNEPLYFTTIEPDKKDISCIVLSDMHEDASKTAKLLENVKWNKTDFVLLNGDFLNNFNEDEDLYAVIDTCVDVFAKEKPLYIVRGNHETRGLKARDLNKHFHFPDNKYYYTFSIGTSFFIVLDSGEDKPDSDIEYSGMADFDSYRSEQAKWLSKIVETDEFKKSEHKIVFMHIPPFLEERGDEWHGEIEIRNKFVPILNKADIDLMLCGHKHLYSFVPKKAGENNFPIIVADNNSKVNLTINSNGIKAEIIDIDSNVISGLFFEK